MWGVGREWMCGGKGRPLKRSIFCRMTAGGSGSEWSWQWGGGQWRDGTASENCELVGLLPCYRTLWVEGYVTAF